MPASNASIKRARRMSTQFPPGSKVAIEWDVDPAYGRGSMRFSGVVDSYDTNGNLTAYDSDRVKLWIPCAKVRIKTAA